LGAPSQFQPCDGQMRLDRSPIGVDYAPLDQAASFQWIG
jgi:hypothetical protein